ncbi:MAG: NAD(P)-binding protein [Christensenellales bacterium]
MQTDCVILGGGAGGLCAAAALGRRRLHVTVVERLPRVGKKLLATGNAAATCPTWI